MSMFAGVQLGSSGALTAVPDPRDPRGTRYPLVGMLAVAMCAVLAGACTFAAITDWMRDLDRPAWGRLGSPTGSRQRRRPV
jgi:hypothetical protein